MIPARLRLLIDWIHIREAERRGRRVTPVDLALVEQSRFARLELQADAVMLFDAYRGDPVRYQPCAELTTFLEQFGQGTPTTPTTFELERVLEDGGAAPAIA